MWKPNTESLDKSLEESENDPPSVFQLQRVSKTRIYWSENPPAWTLIKSCHILRERPGPIRDSTIAATLDAFESFITRNIMNEVTQCANLEGCTVAAARSKVLKKIDHEKFVDFIGLTLLAGVEKKWNVSMWILFLDPLQNPMYKNTMAVQRDKNIERLLRFDDKSPRTERLKPIT